jgi:3-hydroxybutyrate dehydrogenase
MSTERSQPAVAAAQNSPPFGALWRWSTVIAMAAQKRLICVCGECRAEVFCGLVAAAMIWSLTLTCHWREVGTSLRVRGGAEVADQARRDRGAPNGGGPGGPLSGRVAIVTGAAGGLGSATVRALRQAGATVVPVDVYGDDCLTADVATAGGNRRMVDLAVERHGRLDILILNAGAQAMNPIAGYAEADWDRLMNLMVKGPFLAMKFAWPQLTRQPDGRIIVTSSTAGLAGAPYKAAYVAAKHAVLGLVKVAALEGAGAGLTANAVAPGWMRTPLADNQIRDHMRLRGISRDDVIASMLAEQPAGRFVDTTEVAGLITFLAGPGGSAINGACIPVDTGTLAG